jgi:hypothetical protein
MSLPELTHTAEAAYESLAPLATEDAEHDFALAKLVAGIARAFDFPADLARDREDGSPGFAVLFDPDEVDARLLPFVAQFRGLTLPKLADELERRARLRDEGGFYRCGAQAVIDAARRTLTGNQTVILRQRYGSARHALIVTFTDETPDPAATARAIAEEKPAGHRFTHTIITGGDFATITALYADFAEVTSTFDDFAELRDNPA